MKHSTCNKIFRAGASVNAVTFDDVKVISCGDDKVVRLWDVHSSQCMRVLEGHQDSVLCVHADHSGIYSGGRDKLLRVWFLSSASQAATRPHRRSFVPNFSGLLGKGGGSSSKEETAPCK